ncbi:arylesterase [Caenimonas soli]|uniref:arylesterase n=1 Tax=Caenimonas soli TaxID=2735555 RepID=UPI001554B6E9|nr:arylesterase [Caenimonas soli]NPC54031.1 arylesterase [Caenimonas soli]
MFAGNWNRRHFIAAGLAGCYALPAVAAAGKTILVLGDSISAEYGLKRGTGWVPLLEKRLVAETSGARVVNASISGETTSGGRSRLPALLDKHKPDILVLELGGNDGLRGLPLAMTEDNLSHMTQAAQKAGARVLLVGIQVPPNYGADYSSRFAGLYDKVARKHKAAVVPFMLKGVFDGPEPMRMFQPDRIHPTEAAQPLILDTVWPELKKLVK